MRPRIPFTSSRRRPRTIDTPVPRQGLLALPPEILRRILELALGQHLIHVDTEKLPLSLFSRDRWRRKYADGTLRRYHCSVAACDADAWLHPCWSPLAPSRPPDPPLALLVPALTCRALRDEALAVLYEANTLDFKSSHTLAALPRYMPPASIARIRSLRLLIALPEFPNRQPEVRSAYDAHWAAVRALPGLRRLSVLLVLPVCNAAAWRANEEVFLRPVREMPPLERFEFIMPTWLAALSPGVEVGGCIVRGANEVRFLGHGVT